MLESPASPPQNPATSRASAESVVLQVNGMHCAGCVGSVERALRQIPGVAAATVDLASGSATVSGTNLNAAALAEAVTATGFAACPLPPRRSLAEQRTELEEKQRRNVQAWRRRALVGALLWLPIMVVHMPMDLRLVTYSHGFHTGLNVASAVLATLAQVYVGWGFYRSAWQAGRRGTTNMDTLIALGSTVAWGFSAIISAAEWLGYPTGQPVYWEAAAGLLALVSIGHWLEARTMASASSALRELLALQPDRVQRVAHADDGVGTDIATDDVRPGDLLLFRPGDRIAVDGTIVAGASAVDEAAITGEPLPSEKNAGDAVAAGSLNLNGRLVVQASTDGRDTTVARIADVVRTAQSSKAAIARLADRVCAVFVPAVIAIAAATCLGWLAYGLWSEGNTWHTWGRALVAATAVLVISCPCALGLATPTAIMVGAGAASKRGILVKNAAALERAALIDAVLLDKTGTLTAGRPVVADVAALEGDADQLLANAAALATSSRHPLSQALVAASRERGTPPALAANVREQAGRSLAGDVNGSRWELVSLTRALEEGLPLPADWSTAEGTQTVVLRNERPVGMVQFDDELRPDARGVVEQLRTLGLDVLLATGDRATTARRIAAETGIDPADVRSELTPLDKRTEVGRLADEGRHVAMVGDGINDAAALAEAGARGGIGVAIGTGTNIALESADMVVPAHRLEAIPEAIALSRATLRTIKQNLVMSFVYNVIAIPAAAVGLLGTYAPMYAAAAMALSDVGVVGNSLRLKRNLARADHDRDHDHDGRAHEA